MRQGGAVPAAALVYPDASPAEVQASEKRQVKMDALLHAYYPIGPGARSAAQIEAEMRAQGHSDAEIAQYFELRRKDVDDNRRAAQRQMQQFAAETQKRAKEEARRKLDVNYAALKELMTPAADGRGELARQGATLAHRPVAQ